MALNKLILQGNLCKDVETKAVGEHTIGNFTVACNNKVKGEDDTLFMDCTSWNKTAENIAKFFQKGKPIIVEGSLKQEKWVDKESGGNRSKIVMNVQTFHFVGGAGDAAPVNTTVPTAMPNADLPF